MDYPWPGVRSQSKVPTVPAELVGRQSVAGGAEPSEVSSYLIAALGGGRAWLLAKAIATELPPHGVSQHVTHNLI